MKDRGEREEGIGKTEGTERMGDRRKNPACLTFRNLSCNEVLLLAKPSGVDNNIFYIYNFESWRFQDPSLLSTLNLE